MKLEEMKDFKFYRISTDINNRIFLEFRRKDNHAIRLKHSIIKSKGISFYYDTTLYDIFKYNNEIDKYIISEEVR